MQEFNEEAEGADELYEHYRFEVDKGQSLFRIDKFLFHKLENTSRNRIQSAASAGNILVNGKPVKSNYKVRPFDTITIVLAWPKREVEIIPQDIPLNVVFEDEHLIVINKNPGLVVHPGVANYDGTLINALAYYFGDSAKFDKTDVRAGLVHRLDKDTSGIMVVGKSEHAVNHLAKQFFDRTTDRRYQALVWGSCKEKEGTINAHVGRHLKDRTIMAAFPDGAFGRHAVTHYRVIEELGYISLVECKLETGRTHQIRVHMAHIKQPVFNDTAYGGSQILRGTTFTKYKQFVLNSFSILPRQALHAKSLEFEHPASGKRMKFDSELPEDMQLVIDKWRVYTSSRG